METGRTLSHYRLVEKIGEGGMGVVWRAEDTVLGRTVAIKVLPAEVSRNDARQKMFFDEACLASSLSDAHIAQVHEFGREGDLDFIVMEYVEGKPLNKILHGRPLPPDKVVALGVQVARALSRAHRKGLLHRDLKPSNLLVTSDGELKVVDFGLATLFERRDTSSGSDETTRTSSGGPEETPRPARAGTLPYMSPEQIRGEKLDARSDIFSLGVVLYEMTTGQRPFAGTTSGDLAEEILKGRPKTPHELVGKLPLELDRIVQKALGAKREERYQTMDDLAVDLKRLERELESGSAPSYEDLDQLLARTRRRRVRIVTGAGAAALLAAAAGAWWLFSGRGVKLDEHRVLVLPFEVRGQTEGADYAGLAFAEALAVNLAQVKELQVLPVQEGNPSAELKPALKLATDQNVGVLLTGRLVREGEDVQVSVQLLDVGNGRIRWGMQQTALAGDLSGLAASCTRLAMASLGVASPKIYEHPFHLTGDAELAKSPLAIEAVAAYNRSDKGAMALACSKLTDAFPQSVEARAIALFAVDNISEIDPQSTKNKKALHDAIAAVDALDPANPYTTMVRAYALYAGAGKNREAIELLTSVIARSDLSPALRAWALRRRALPESSLGNRAAAISDAQEAIRLDPTTAGCYQVLSRALRLAGRPDEALERAQQALALDPTYWYNWEYVGIALGDLGQQKESLPYRIRACELSGAQAACTMTALSLLKLSRTADARAAAEYAAKLTPSIYGAYNLACYHAVAGERSDAFTFLHRALDLGYSDALIETDSDFTSLRGDPEFEKIVVEVKARIAKQRER